MATNMFLYQIDGMRYPLYLKKQNELIDSYQNSSPVKTVETAYSNRKYAVFAQWQPKLQVIKVRADLLNTEMRTAQQLYQELQWVVGFPTGIIAYSLEDIHPDDYCGCSCVSGCNRCVPKWWWAIGIVQDVKFDQNSDPFATHNFSVDIELHTYWKPLDLYTWQWGSGVNSPFVKYNSLVEPFCENISRLPDCGEVQACTSQCKGWLKRVFSDQDYVYNPEYWASLVFDCDGSLNGNGIARPFASGNPTEALFSDRLDYGAPKQSMYAFTKMIPTGTLQISVSGQWGNSLQTEIATLDLATLDTHMADQGYTGIDDDDVLYVGDVTYYFNGSTYRPAFVLRNNAILEDVHPILEYSTWFPGFVPPGEVNISINVPSGVRTAYLHLNRRL